MRGPRPGHALAVALACGALGIIGCQSVWPTDTPERTTNTVEEAELALARNDIAQANRLFDRALESAPRNGRALVGSARARLAAERGEPALARFDSYREVGGPWRRAEQYDHCSALALAGEQVLEAGSRPDRAHALAERLAATRCEEHPADELLLRSGLQLADREIEAGRHASALPLYLAIIDDRDAANRSNVRAVTETTVRYDDPHLARAYLSASRLLLADDRRDEALALLSRGLDELPGNRDLVHLMVTVLAEGSNVVFPREKPPGSQAPAAPR